MLAKILTSPGRDLPGTDPWSSQSDPTQGEIRAMAETRLRQSPYAPLHQVSCELRSGVLTLGGRVPSYYLKQIAQTVVRSVEGVLEINNQLHVGPRPSGLDRP
jgi:osmotically-inducible protein OsmY